MRIRRFDDDRIGVARDGIVHDVGAITDRLPVIRYPFPPGDALIANLDGLRVGMESLADEAPAPGTLSFTLSIDGIGAMDVAVRGHE
jgi:hypothetical protein